MNKFQQSLLNYIDELISDKATYDSHDGYQLSIHDLHDLETNKLLRLQLEADGRDMQDVFFEDKSNLDDNCINAFFRILANDTRNTRNDFIDIILKNALERYSEKLQSLIDEMCSAKEYESRQLNKQYSSVNRTTGERQWLSL